ncbi:MAG: helix-turn-helix transcriptional regulator [Alistipes sp.]|nr:helix-turn-helix transcriptional regulator [Alistipes sp.]
MKEHKCLVRTLGDLFPDEERRSMRRMINCSDADAERSVVLFGAESYIKATTVIFVVEGGCRVEINHHVRSLQRGDVLLLSVSHLFRVVDAIPSLRCRLLVVSEEFMSAMDARDMIYRRIKYGVRLYNEPVVRLADEQMMRILSRMDAVDAAIGDIGHRYYRELILNALDAFYLDMSNVVEQDATPQLKDSSTRRESMVKAFVELLVENFRREHKVDFYASRLNISAHYLTFVVREITGQTASELIFDMLYAEARALLSTSQMSIQEITALLNFADQSSFGKFFKRRAGVSPYDYRKE